MGQECTMEKVFPVHTHHQSFMVHWWVLVQSGQQRATNKYITGEEEEEDLPLFFLALPTKGKDIIVFRFIIEYHSLRNFGPQVIIIGLFLYEDFCFETWYFGLCWNLRLVIELYFLEGFWFFLEDFLKIIFLHGEIFEFPLFFFCLKVLFNVNWQGHSVIHPLF